MITWKQALPNYEWLIHQVWYLEVEPNESVDLPPKLIPNPLVHIVLSPETQPYHYRNDENTFTGYGCHLLTASEQLLTLSDQAPLKRIGITLKPDALYLLSQSAPSQTNHIAWPEWIDNWLTQDVVNTLLTNPTPEALLPQITSLLEKRDFSLTQDQAYQQVHKAIQILDSEDIYIDSDTLAQQCACSRRTLERSFRTVVGLTIKKYQMLTNLDAMILALYQDKQPIDWAAFSQRFGFNDQSHFIRQLKQLLKTTPANYLKKRDLTIDVYGDFE